jgi:hypothetical protein
VVAAGVTFTAMPLVTAFMPLLTEPVAPVVALNTAVSVVELPAVMVEAPVTKLVIAGAGTTVSVTGEVTAVPAAFVTVRVYVVVVAGETFTAVPLVMAFTPLLTVAVPPGPALNTAVSVVEFPAVMLASPAVKLVITGTGTTVTVAVEVTAVPAALVTVRVYVVVAAGVIFTAVPLVTVPTLVSIEPLPPLKTAVSVVEVPSVIVVFAAAKLVITGAATTVTVA